MDLREFLSYFDFDYDIVSPDGQTETKIRTELLEDGELSAADMDKDLICLIDTQGAYLGGIGKNRYPIAQESIEKIIDRMDVYIQDSVISEFVDALEDRGVDTSNLSLSDMIVRCKDLGVGEGEVCYTLAEAVADPGRISLQELVPLAPEWFITDGDCLQCCRPLPAINPKQFELVQINSFDGRNDDPPIFQTAHVIIDLNEYTDEEVLSELNAFGYTDMDDFVLQNSSGGELVYNEDGTLDREHSPGYVIEYQLIAEMFFESRNYEYADQEFSTWNEAVARIEQLTGLDLSKHLETEKEAPSMEVKKIKVYDMDALFKEADMLPFRYNKVAIFEGPKGVIVAEHEAVHMMENLVTDSIVLPATKIPEPGRIPLFPTHEATLQISELMTAPYTEMTIEEFFDRRSYNPRCQDNYASLMGHLREIGFDLHGYFPTRQTTLDDKIKSATQRTGSKSAEPKGREDELTIGR